MKLTLLEALIKIQTRFPNTQVTMIEFEDGSGTKFNYRLAGIDKNHFINFANSKNESAQRVEEAAKIMAKW